MHLKQAQSPSLTHLVRHVRSPGRPDAPRGHSAALAGYARLIIEQRTKFISSSDPEITAADCEVNRDAETFDNRHIKTPGHGQGAFA